MTSIKTVDLTKISEANFPKRFVGAIILTHDNKFLLQKIINARTFFSVGYITTFGGKVETNEAPIEALKRELNEELGAKVGVDESIYIGAITEKVTKHTELIYIGVLG